VGLDGEENIEVSGRRAAQARFAFAGQPDAGAVLDPRRNGDRQLFDLLLPPAAAAGVAGVVDYPALAVARRAGALDGEKTRLRRAPGRGPGRLRR